MLCGSNLSLLKCVATLSIVSLLLVTTILLIMNPSKSQTLVELKKYSSIQQGKTSNKLSLFSTPDLPARNLSSLHLNSKSNDSITTASQKFNTTAITILRQMNNTITMLKQMNNTMSSHLEHKGGLLRNISVNANCRNKWCISLIPSNHRHYYTSCEAMTYRRTSVDPSTIPQRCTFMDGQGRVPVALVSVPGSGNTWVRGLLEKATGICTGSIYCDSPLRNKGFVGEYVHDGSVLVVKTHTSDYQWKDAKLIKRNREDAYYSSAILLIRNPFDTFIAERHRLRSLAQMERKPDNSHIAEFGREEFGSNKDWDKHVQHLGERWKKTMTMWYGSAQTQHHPLLLVHYEDFKRDSLGQVLKILNFLHVDYNKGEVKMRLQGGFTAVQRNHTTHFQHYTEDQTAYVTSMIASTMTELQAMGVELDLTKYMK